MSRVPLIALLAAGLAITAAIVIGAVGSLTSSSGSNTSGQQAGLERSIRSQLPGQLRQKAGRRVKIDDLGCVDGDGDRYDCVAKVQPVDARGHSEVVSLSIIGSCDTKRCVWRTRGQEGAAEPARPAATEDEEAGSTMPEPEHGWSTMTCGEVEKAVKEEDLEWLGIAGHAVAYQAIAQLPDASEGKLVRLAARDLVRVCVNSSNTGYQPFEEAEALLIGQLERLAR